MSIVEHIKTNLNRIQAIDPRISDDFVVKVVYKAMGISSDDYTEDFCPFTYLEDFESLNVPKYIPAKKKSCFQTKVKAMSVEHGDWSKSKLYEAARKACGVKRDDGESKGKLNQVQTHDRKGNVVSSYTRTNPNDVRKNKEKEKEKRHNDGTKSDFELPMSVQYLIEVDTKLGSKKDFQSIKDAYKSARIKLENRVDFTDDSLSTMRPISLLTRLNKSATNGATSSSHVDKIGFDGKNLLVNFENGATYSYDVDRTFYEEMANSESKGKYVWNHLRGKSPGHVYGNPSKMTAGGVGGSIVPYDKIGGSKERYSQGTKGIKATPFRSKDTFKNVDTGSFTFNEHAFEAFQKDLDQFSENVKKGLDPLQDGKEREAEFTKIETDKDADRKAEAELANIQNEVKAELERIEIERQKVFDEQLKIFQAELARIAQEKETQELLDEAEHIRDQELLVKELARIEKEKADLKAKIEAELRAQARDIDIRDAELDTFDEIYEMIENEVERVAQEQVDQVVKDTTSKVKRDLIKKVRKDVKAAEKKVKAAKSPKKPTDKKTPSKKKVSSEKKEEVKKELKIIIDKRVKKEDEDDDEPEDNSYYTDQITKLQKQIAKLRKTQPKSPQIKILLRKIQSLRNEMTTSDFIEGTHTFSGRITRAGDFQYPEGIRTKEYNNLKDIFTRTTHFPSFDAHTEDEMIGFAYDFTFDDSHQEIFVNNGYTFQSIEDLTGLSTEEIKQTDFPVSIRFLDSNQGTDDHTQIISEVLHLAVSLDRKDKDRCSSVNGAACSVRFNSTELIGDFMPDPKDKKDSPEVDKKEESDEGAVEEKESTSPKKEKKVDKKAESDFVPRSEYNELKAELERIGKIASDFEGIDLKKLNDDFTARQAKFEQTQKATFIAKLKDNPAIKADFLESATLAQLETMHNAVGDFEYTQIDISSTLGTSKEDFAAREDTLTQNLKERFSFGNSA